MKTVLFWRITQRVVVILGTDRFSRIVGKELTTRCVIAQNSEVLRRIFLTQILFSMWVTKNWRTITVSGPWFKQATLECKTRAASVINPSVSDNLKHSVPACTRCPSRDPVSLASEGRQFQVYWTWRLVLLHVPSYLFQGKWNKLAIVVEKCKTG